MESTTSCLLAETSVSSDGGFDGSMSVTISFRRRIPRLLQTQGPLTVSMVVPTRTLLVFAVVLSLFLHPRQLATSLRAISMASVAAATDRPQLGTGWVAALAHEQDLLGMSGHACPKRDWTTTAGSCEAKPHLQVVASPAGGRLQTRPRSPLTIGVFLLRSRRASLIELTDVSHRLRSLRWVSLCAGPLRGPALAKRDRGPLAEFAPAETSFP